MESVRVKNLKRLIGQHESQNQAASAMGLDAPALSRIVTGQSALGTRRARSIEQALSLRKGWLDEYQDDVRGEWIQACCSALSGGDDVQAAMEAADTVVDGIRSRFLS